MVRCLYFLKTNCCALKEGQKKPYYPLASLLNGDYSERLRTMLQGSSSFFNVYLSALQYIYLNLISFDYLIPCDKEKKELGNIRMKCQFCYFDQVVVIYLSREPDEQDHLGKYPILIWFSLNYDNLQNNGSHKCDSYQHA